MHAITFVTGNEHKIASATDTCAAFGIAVEPASLDIIEIQAEDGEAIARDKAQKAYALLQKPVVVVDDTWVVPGLNGFPGPYMKSVNHWLSPQDWLRLTLPLTDRRIILRQYAVYQDDSGQTLFTNDITGTLLTEVRGEQGANCHEYITCFNDEGKSSVEMRNLGKRPISNQLTVWDKIAPWLAAQN